MKEDELQSILNYLLTMHEVNPLVCVFLRETVGDGGGGLSGAGGKMGIINRGLELWST